MNNCIEFIPVRDRELYNAYKTAFRRPDVKSHKQAIQAAIKSETSRFWISTFQAYREILKIKKGKPTGCVRTVRKRMIQKYIQPIRSWKRNPRSEDVPRSS